MSWKFNPFTGKMDYYEPGGTFSGTSDDITEGTTHLFYTSADKTKLAGIDNFATANYPNSYLMARANHTGTQTASTISDFNTSADARITVQKGVNGGLCPLDGSTKVDKTYIYAVNKQYANASLFPVTGETDTIYIDQSTHYPYYWNGSAYVFAGRLVTSLDDVGDGTTFKHFTEARVRSTPLTGLDTSGTTAITSSETVLSGMGKLQGQINTNTTNISSNTTAIAGKLDSFPVLTNSAMVAALGSYSESRIVYNSTYRCYFRRGFEDWEPIGPLEPRFGTIVMDEFINGNSGTASAGELGWTVGGTFQGVQGDGQTVGVALLRQATAATRSFASSSVLQAIPGSFKDEYMEFMVKVPTLATSTEDFVLEVGIGNNTAYSATGSQTNAIKFQYNRAVNGSNWQCVTTNSSTSTTTNTTTAVSTGWQRLRIEVIAGATVNFIIGTTTVATHTTNIPINQAMGYLLKMNKVAGTGNSDMWIDYFRTRIHFTANRC